MGTLAQSAEKCVYQVGGSSFGPDIISLTNEMYLGSFDDEPATVEVMDAYLLQNGYENDFNDVRLHHEIYLSDARKVTPEKWKTVIRHPIKKK